MSLEQFEMCNSLHSQLVQQQWRCYFSWLPVRQEFMENECEALPGVAYPEVRDNRSTINTKTGYDDDDVLPDAILLPVRRENPSYRYWVPVAAARRGFKMVLFTTSRGNTFVRGKCTLPSALLVFYYSFF